jgi:hypothetical protein
VQNTLSQSISIRGRRVIAAGAGYARLREGERFGVFKICRRGEEKLRNFPRRVLGPGRFFMLRPVDTKNNLGQPVINACLFGFCTLSDQAYKRKTCTSSQIGDWLIFQSLFFRMFQSCHTKIGVHLSLRSAWQFAFLEGGSCHGSVLAVRAHLTHIYYRQPTNFLH